MKPFQASCVFCWSSLHCGKRIVVKGRNPYYSCVYAKYDARVHSWLAQLSRKTGNRQTACIWPKVKKNLSNLPDYFLAAETPGSYWSLPGNSTAHSPPAKLLFSLIILYKENIRQAKSSGRVKLLIGKLGGEVLVGRICLIWAEPGSLFAPFPIFVLS